MKPIELLDPEFYRFLAPGTDAWSLETLPAIRARVGSAWVPAQAARCEQRWTSGTAPVRLCLYRPKSLPCDVKLPVVLYIHGGGFVLGKPEMVDDFLADLAENLQTLIVAVDYRLAPEYPFPLPLQDCYSALEWIVASQDELGIDASRLVVMGHSAGGGLAASLSIMARDKGEHSIAGLILVYPMLDYRTGSDRSPYQNPTIGTIGWSSVPNQFCWACVRANYALDDDRIGLFSAAMQGDLSDLPPSFISVGALDLFLEEDVAFALRLSRAGVPVELHVYPGAPHMFDQTPGRISNQSVLDVNRALKQFLSKIGPITPVQDNCQQ